MFKIKSICLHILLFCTAVTASARDRQLFDDGWLFLLGDSVQMAQPDYHDTHWRSLKLPHDWAVEGDFSVDNPSGAGGGALQVGADHATVPYLRGEDQNPTQATHIQVRQLWVHGTQRHQGSPDHGVDGTIQVFRKNTLGTRGIQACGERIGVIRGQSAYVLHVFGETGNRDGFSLTVVHMKKEL